MIVDRKNKQVIPENANEVIDVWACPSSMDYRSGGAMCSNFAAQIYANLDYEEAKEWTLYFAKPGYRTMFTELEEAYESKCDYMFEHGEIPDEDYATPRSSRAIDDPILRVANAFRKDSHAFTVEVAENDEGMLGVTLINKQGNEFSFSILDDYAIFFAFSYWLADHTVKQYAAEQKDSADKFLAAL